MSYIRINEECVGKLFIMNDFVSISHEYDIVFSVCKLIENHMRVA